MQYVMAAQRMMRDHIAVTGGDVIDSFIFQAVMAANIAYVDSTPETPSPWSDLSRAQIPLEDRRPISISALAASLDMPRQTAWRRLQRLIEVKLILQTPAGVVTPPGDPNGNAYDDALVANTIFLAAFLRDARFDEEARDRDRRGALAVMTAAAPPHRTVGRLSTTFVLYVVTEFARRTTGDLVDGYLQAGLALACGRPGRDGQPARTAPTRSVADLTGLAEETARRRLLNLARAGFVQRSPRGYEPAWGPDEPAAALPDALDFGVARLARQVARLGA